MPNVATARTITLEGAVGHLVDVEVDVSQGVVMTSLVGRPDAAINESRDRCRTAITNSGFTWPSTRRLTILLSPADLPKRGTQFDLAIAIGVLAASGQVRREHQWKLDRAVFLGELTLAGGLRCVPGVLAMVMAAAARGVRRVFVPEPQVREASLVPDVEVLGFRSLAQVVAELNGEAVPEATAVPEPAGRPVLRWRGDDRLGDVDLRDLLGMAEARFALEVAAAGGHHLLLSGPKGAGKTSLAERLPGILPDLTLEESLELTAVHSLAGVLDTGAGLVDRPPLFAPHHTVSKVSLLGGGSGRVRPGEISRAHCGVVLLDEFPLFASDIVEALRQPLESGEVTIARGEETATFPARGMFVLACNPCRCGNYSNVSEAGNWCTCSAVELRDYRRKLEGPVIDRIDITRHVAPVREHEANDPLTNPEDSDTVRARVAAARARQTERYAGLPWRLNAHVPGPRLRELWPLPRESARLLDQETFAGRLTRRGATRVHRVAWTLADLAGAPTPTAADVATALRLRNGDPLDSEVLRRAG